MYLIYLLLTATLLLSACSSGSSVSPHTDTAAATTLDTETDTGETTQISDTTSLPGTTSGTDTDSDAADQSETGTTVTTESGLIYEVLRAADGPKPGENSYVTLDYEGTLIDGTVFDSSYERGEASTFLLANTIEGFKEGVQLMSVGSRYRFTIPSELGYGDTGTGALIGPGATLVFDVELHEINS